MIKLKILDRLSPSCIIFIGLVCLFVLTPAQNVYAQMVEICDNGIDDDNDGLIDINDDDCVCPIDFPVSLIPNPSFEDQTGCPTSENMLELAIPWQQASQATTDYMHTCNGFISHPLFAGSVPLPMPDGEGCIGFRNGKANIPNFKEYTGACLIDPLEAETPYTLNMWVGFMDSSSSPEFELTIFGAEDCVNGILPFGNGNPNIGCPLNVNGFEQLGSTIVSGENEWVNIVVNLTTTKALNVIVIGGNCEANPRENYYFFDNLILQKTIDFGEPPAVIGHPCMNNVELLRDQMEGESYQWFKDGIAILNDTSVQYTIPESQVDPTTYQIMITGDTTCEISAPYFFEIPTFETMQSITICDNEPLQLSNQSVLEEGMYSELLVSYQGCDSTVITEVTVNPTYDIFLAETICAREQYILGEQILELEGIYTEFFRTVEDCDSIVTIELTVLPSLVSVDAQGDKTIRLGELAPIRAVVSDPSLIEQIFWSSSDSLTTICDTCLYQVVAPANTTTYSLTAFDIKGCNVSDNVTIMVDKFYDAYFPNAFSPNGDGVNDFFYIHGTTNIAQIKNLEIFDRWGSHVYKKENFPASTEFEGWDGYLRGVPVSVGIYTYFSEIEFIDGHIALFKGDLVILR